jgi:hypothetical protein
VEFVAVDQFSEDISVVVIGRHIVVAFHVRVRLDGEDLYCHDELVTEEGGVAVGHWDRRRMVRKKRKEKHRIPFLPTNRTVAFFMTYDFKILKMAHPAACVANKRIKYLTG